MGGAGDSSVVFVDGFAKDKNWIYVSAELKALAEEDIDYTRIFSWKNGQWGCLELDQLAIRSVCAASLPQRAIHFLDEEGEVVTLTPEGLKRERIPDAGTERGRLGCVVRMREIAKNFYVCGTHGQIYRRESSGWAHYDQGVLGPSAPDLNCIDGISKNNIYVVGDRGTILHHGGESWKYDNPLTKEHLRWVRCISQNEIYVCGRKGAFFRGYFSNWTDLSNPTLREHFSCVEVFEGKVYLASASSLYVLDGNQIQRIDTGLSPTPDGHRLHASDGVLWSFGSRHLCFFDGKKWTYVKHPDNP